MKKRPGWPIFKKNVTKVYLSLRLKCRKNSLLYLKRFCKVSFVLEVVVAQLVEQLLHIPEVHGSNPVIGKHLPLLNIYCI